MIPAVLADDFGNLGIDYPKCLKKKYFYAHSFSLTWPSHTVIGISTFYIPPNIFKEVNPTISFNWK